MGVSCQWAFSTNSEPGTIHASIAYFGQRIITLYHDISQWRIVIFLNNILFRTKQGSNLHCSKVFSPTSKGRHGGNCYMTFLSLFDISTGFWDLICLLISAWCHIYASMNRISFGSDNGLSPIRHQAIIYHNAASLSIGPLGTNFSEILIKI